MLVLVAVVGAAAAAYIPCLPETRPGLQIVQSTKPLTTAGLMAFQTANKQYLTEANSVWTQNNAC